METLKAVAFTNLSQLKQELVSLNTAKENNMAVLASFHAQAPNGEIYELSCFIERDGFNLDITEVVGADLVDTAMLQFDLLHHATTKMC